MEPNGTELVFKGLARTATEAGEPVIYDMTSSALSGPREHASCLVNASGSTIM